MTETLPVKVYLADVRSLTDEKTFLTYYDTVSEERKAKIDAMRFSKDKCLSLGAGVLLNKALTDTGMCCNLPLVAGSHDKPILRDHPDFHFNLSHSGTKVLCVCSSVTVGCDVEMIRSGHEKIAKRFFTKKEQQLLDAVNEPEEKQRLFYRLWTCKESFVKATGYGLTYGLERFTVDLEDDQPVLCKAEDDLQTEFSISSEDLSKYSLIELKMDEAYCGAVCVYGESRPSLSIIVVDL